MKLKWKGWEVDKTLVVERICWLYMGIKRRHYKDPYLTTNLLGNKRFSFLARMGWTGFFLGVGVGVKQSSCWVEIVEWCIYSNLFGKIIAGRTNKHFVVPETWFVVDGCFREMIAALSYFIHWDNLHIRFFFFGFMYKFSTILYNTWDWFGGFEKGRVSIHSTIRIPYIVCTIISTSKFISFIHNFFFSGSFQMTTNKNHPNLPSPCPKKVIHLATWLHQPCHFFAERNLPGCKPRVGAAQNSLVGGRRGLFGWSPFMKKLMKKIPSQCQFVESFDLDIYIYICIDYIGICGQEKNIIRWEMGTSYLDGVPYPSMGLFWGPYMTLPLIYRFKPIWIVQWSLGIPHIFDQLFFLGPGPVVVLKVVGCIFFKKHRWRTNGFGPWSSVWTMRPWHGEDW